MIIKNNVFDILTNFLMQIMRKNTDFDLFYSNQNLLFQGFSGTRYEGISFLKILLSFITMVLNVIL